MDVSTFYALFSATCFTLVGLWWSVVLRDTGWAGDPVRRRAIGGVYLAFLLPGLMGLFAQVAGVRDPLVWRIAFLVIAVVGCAATLGLLARGADRGLAAIRGAIGATHARVGLVAAFPAVAAPLGLRPIQVAALLLVLLVALGHGLVWHHLVHEAAGTSS